MSESSNVTSIFSQVFNPENPDHVMADVAAYLRPDLPPNKRPASYGYRLGDRQISVRVSREALVLIAGSDDLSTPQIIERFNGVIDRQIAQMMTWKPKPIDGRWTLDADDVVPIL